MDKKRILILGGGFVGVYAFLKLHSFWHNNENIEISIVSDKNYFLFVPMIHEVATGNLPVESVIQPIRQIFNCCMTEFIEGKVVSMDLDKKTVLVDSKNIGKIEKKFDYVVLGLGSEVNYFSVRGAKEHTIGLKTIPNAVDIKNKIIDSFEKASLCQDEKDIERYLNFVVVGGGPTGVELAGEICDLISDEIKNIFPNLTEKAKVYLVSPERVLEKADDWCSQKAYSILNKIGAIVVNKKVVKVDGSRVFFNESGTDCIDTKNIFWNAGVRAVDVDINPVDAVEKDNITNRIKVLRTLQLSEKYPYVFVGGDMMWLKDYESDQPYPMRAQFAVREGECIAKNITNLIKNKKLYDFHWNDKGFIVSLGKGNAFAHIGRFKFTGFFAWWLYRTAYLFKLVGMRAKLKTAFEWTLNLFLPRDVSKIKYKEHKDI